LPCFFAARAIVPPSLVRLRQSGDERQRRREFVEMSLAAAPQGAGETAAAGGTTTGEIGTGGTTMGFSGSAVSDIG